VSPNPVLTALILIKAAGFPDSKQTLPTSGCGDDHLGAVELLHARRRRDKPEGLVLILGQKGRLSAGEVLQTHIQSDAAPPW